VVDDDSVGPRASVDCQAANLRLELSITTFRCQAKLADLWNNSFFAPRSIEVVPFKGHERRSGPCISQIECNLPGFDWDADSSDSLSSDDLVALLFPHYPPFY
jgi:hypothetical protein